MKNELLHVDFMEVELDKLVSISVPIHLVAEPAGITMGGRTELITREVEVECLPKNIPAHIDIDASSIQVGDSFYVRDIIVSNEIKILNDPKTAILTVTAEAKEVVEKEEEVAEEAEETEETEEKAEE